MKFSIFTSKKDKNNDSKIQSSFEKKVTKKFRLFKIYNRKITNNLDLQNINWFYLYSDVFNLNFILKNGIKICKDIILKDNQKYIVWSFSQLQDQINLVLENDKKIFWDWFYEQKINDHYIMTVAINKNELFNFCKKKWNFNKNILTIFESIPVELISWILVHNKKKFNEGNLIIKNNNLKIKMFYGSEGQIINDEL